MGSRGTERGRIRRGALLAASVSTFAALLGAEILARAFFGVPLRERLPIVEVRADDRCGYVMLPDRDHFTYEHPVHVNHLGLRGPDLERKVPREFRILCLGDSTTYGQGVADSDTIPALLDVELAHLPPSAERRIRVVNAGVRGYGTREEIGLLEEIRAEVEPDLVVLLWYPNDLERPEIESNREKLSASGPVAFDTGARMEGAELVLWNVRQLVRRSALVVKARHLIADLVFHRLTASELDQGLLRFDEDLARFRPLVQKLVVGVIPASESLRGTDVDEALHARIGDLARGHGFDFVDLTPALRELVARTNRLPILPYDGHYTGEANLTMARALAARIATRIAGGL